MMIEGGKRVASPALNAMPAPLFTIVTAVRNGARSIERTIQSVANQTFRDFEYLVVDAASDDGTVRILEQCNDLIDYWRSEPDRGIYDAFNKGIRLARGEWIAFLGADDEYYPDALQSYADFLSTDRSAGLQYISSRVELTRAGRVYRTVGKAWSWRDFSKFMSVAHVGSMHHRTLFGQFGPFDETYRICGDYELLLRPRANLRTAFLPITTARMAYGGISNLHPLPVLFEVRRAKRTSGGRPALLCLVEYGYAFAKWLIRLPLR
jgi:glycosyltransferase involved in cell wall biosynthesis